MAKAQGYSPDEYLSKARNECTCVTIAGKQNKKTKKAMNGKRWGKSKVKGSRNAGHNEFPAYGMADG